MHHRGSGKLTMSCCLPFRRCMSLPTALPLTPLSQVRARRESALTRESNMSNCSLTRSIETLSELALPWIPRKARALAYYIIQSIVYPPLFPATDFECDLSPGPGSVASEASVLSPREWLADVRHSNLNRVDRFDNANLAVAAPHLFDLQSPLRLLPQLCELIRLPFEAAGMA